MFYKTIQFHITVLFIFSSITTYAQPYPSLSDKEYSEWYPLRMSRSTMPAVEHESFETMMAEMSLSQPVKALSVGAGTGTMEAVWGPKIHAKWGLERFDAIEPNPCHYGPLKEAFQTLESKTEDLKWNIFTDRIEDFWGNDDQQRYDMIFLTHVIHWFDSPITHLKKLRERLTPDGKIFIVIHSAEGVPRLYPSFYKLFAGHEAGCLTVEALSSQLSDENISHNVRKFHATLDVHEILFDQLDGLKLLSFLFARNLLNITPEHLRKIKATLHDCLTRDNNEELSISEPVAWLTIEASES